MKVYSFELVALVHLTGLLYQTGLLALGVLY
jgi:hypothetical protein